MFVPARPEDLAPGEELLADGTVASEGFGELMGMEVVARYGDESRDDDLPLDPRERIAKLFGRG